jgi:hypothetical protein
VHKSLLRVRIEVQFACRVKGPFSCRAFSITTDKVAFKVARYVIYDDAVIAVKTITNDKDINNN